MTTVEMEIPEEMVSFATPKSEQEQTERNAMILYPYVHNGIISHGRAAEILGMFKMDLIALYGKLGLPYIDMTDEEFEEEVRNVKKWSEAVA